MEGVGMEWRMGWGGGSGCDGRWDWVEGVGWRRGLGWVVNGCDGSMGLGGRGWVGGVGVERLDVMEMGLGGRGLGWWIGFGWKGLGWGGYGLVKGMGWREVVC